VSNRAIYRNINPDDFPPRLEVTFADGQSRQTLFYEKVTWTIEDEERGLRYGENPDQQASLYRLVNGNLRLGEVECIAPGRYLASDVELLQSGKHPGKINITDTDSALNILRYLDDRPATVIIKHNNPCGVATADGLAESYLKAYYADRVAAFGGAVAVNRELDLATAEAIAESYSEVVVAPAFAPGTIERLSSRKNLRIMRVANMERLREYVGEPVVELKSLIDGGLVVQWSQTPRIRSAREFLPARTERKGRVHEIARPPDAQELADMYFGWMVEFGVTSNSVIYVRDGVTVGIGTGEQDRVGVAEIARDKAYRKFADRLAWERHGSAYHDLEGDERGQAIWAETVTARGGLPGSAMISDAFFPFRDGVDVGIREGVSAVVQPGGSLRDHEVIDACNEASVTMVFTGQRSFRH
jgi:phosphoribosylaminoimidazolecarboxamide formyltransferase / IMP cyclohydrolase